MSASSYAFAVERSHVKAMLARFNSVKARSGEYAALLDVLEEHEKIAVQGGARRRNVLIDARREREQQRRAAARLIPLAVSEVIDRVAAAHGVERKHILSDSHHTEVVAARREAMWRAWQILRSPSQVGRIFLRDHSTIISACKRYEKLREQSDIARARDRRAA